MLSFICINLPLKEEVLIFKHWFINFVTSNIFDFVPTLADLRTFFNILVFTAPGAIAKIDSLVFEKISE